MSGEKKITWLPKTCPPKQTTQRCALNAELKWSLPEITPILFGGEFEHLMLACKNVRFYENTQDQTTPIIPWCPRFPISLGVSNFIQKQAPDRPRLTLPGALPIRRLPAPEDSGPVFPGMMYA
jgi:hypothetical protein